MLEAPQLDHGASISCVGQVEVLQRVRVFGHYGVALLVVNPKVYRLIRPYLRHDPEAVA